MSSAPEPPVAVVIHVSPGPVVRWVYGDSLVTGSVREIARALVERVERVSAVRG